MKSDFKQFISDTWPFFVSFFGTAFVIGFIINDVETENAKFKFKVEYTLGRYWITDYTDSITKTEGQIFYKNKKDQPTQVTGNFTITEQ